ncbi:hypothetical protein HMH01_01335 [Halovulum dunhuangense]|uniref:Sialate O-acetylesterase domain-containing protein n=1 Tax=Halovulum dunhuangense TaxID=1505036 RepID=A0A849KUR4_9RHOB|nr:sialate O-acetylesterase [Halovulum dunhuangense]NNU79068.1 hypothetical protein [Halovulum dunhuangense]
MRLGPALSPMAAPVLGRPRAGRPVPDGVLPQPVARLDQAQAWTLDAEWSHGDGAFAKVPGTVKRYASVGAALPVGPVWVAFTVSGSSAGAVGVQLTDPFVNNPFANRITAQHVARFQSVGHGGLRLSGNAEFDGRIEDVQAVPMGALLAQPSDIYIAAGQSLMAAEAQSGPVDPARDYWVPRCLYVPGFTNTTFGTVAGQVAACAAPLQMTVASQGVSPAHAFALAIEKRTPPGRTVLIVACARGGSQLVGSEAGWNPDGTGAVGGTLYAGMVARTQAALALNPDSRVRGLLWAQGESDRSATMDQSYPPAFAAMLARLRADLAEPELPAMILGPMPDDAAPDQALFLQTQARLDQDSGHATAIPHVHYVARPAGWMSADGTHPVAEGNRIAGRLAAARFMAEGHV